MQLRAIIALPTFKLKIVSSRGRNQKNAAATSAANEPEEFPSSNGGVVVALNLSLENGI